MILDNENIIQTNADCDDCEKLCYRITVCGSDPVVTYYGQDDFSTYNGRVIQYLVGEDIFCAEVEAYKCKDEEHDLFPYIVQDCFDTCENCFPPEPEPEPEFKLNLRTVKPGYDTPGCPPEYYEKVKSNYKLDNKNKTIIPG